MKNFGLNKNVFILFMKKKTTHYSVGIKLKPLLLPVRRIEMFYPNLLSYDL